MNKFKKGDVVKLSKLGVEHFSKEGWKASYRLARAVYEGKKATVYDIDDLESNLVNFYPQQRILFGGGGLKDWSEFDVKQFCKEYLK